MNIEQANTPKRLPEATTGESKETKSEAISVQAGSHELGSSDNLQINEHNRARGKSKSSRKRSPNLMQIVLDALIERPIFLMLPNEQAFTLKHFSTG